MDIRWLLLLLLCFLAVALLVESLWMLWNERHSATAQRLARRLSGLSSDSSKPVSQSLLRAEDAVKPGGLAGRLQSMAAVAHLQRLLARAGIAASAGARLVTTAASSVVLMLLLAVVGLPWFVLVSAGVAVLVLPWLWVARRGRLRLALMQSQLPEAVELIARALRAGHALPVALQMVGSEGPAPIAGEFSRVTEQISFGVSAEAAMQALAERIPVEDVRYFVIAVLLQRETGGNLAELLDNIGRLIRDRQKLQQKVRVLSAEGRLSVWILSILPFALAAVISVVNPELTSVLWTDPAGRNMVVVSLVMMGFGIGLMRMIVRVRV